MVADNKEKVLIIFVFVSILMFTLAYASVPLYQVFCQLTGYGGTPIIQATNQSTLGADLITINFQANVDPALPWSFKPVYTSMDVRVGEPALSFYRATNHSDKHIVGVATYNVIPEECSPYFNKIQCFCFDEQSLSPQETIDMPVLFYIDSDILQDSRASEVQQITLSYTFFSSTDMQ